MGPVQGPSIQLTSFNTFLHSKRFKRLAWRLIHLMPINQREEEPSTLRSKAEPMQSTDHYLKTTRTGALKRMRGLAIEPNPSCRSSTTSLGVLLAGQSRRTTYFIS